MSNSNNIGKLSATATNDSTSNLHKQSEIRTLTRMLESCAAEFPTRGIPGVSARFMPHISVNKMEVHVSLLFPLHGAVNVAALNAALDELAPHCVQAYADSTQRSLLFGSTITRSKPDIEAPVFWDQKLRRIPQSRYASVVISEPLARRIKSETLPCFPGEFTPYWPGWTGAGGERCLPEPLHHCRKLFFDYVREVSQSSDSPEATGVRKTAYLRVTFVLDLNVKEALEQHDFNISYGMDAEDMLRSLYPSTAPHCPLIRTMRVCSPPVSQGVLGVALKNIIHSAMSVYYADLRRAMGLVPTLPVASVLPSTWQDALHLIRLSSMEIDRHLYSADAEQAYCELKSQTLKWRQRQEEKAIAAGAEESEVSGNSRIEHSAALSPYALHESADSFSVVLHTAKNGSATPDVKMIVRLVDSHYIRVGLRLNGRNGICHHIPQNRKGSRVRFAGSWYTLPRRTNVCKTLDDFVSTMLMCILYAQKQYEQLNLTSDGLVYAERA